MAGGALDVASGFPGGEDFEVAFVDAAEDDVEGLHGAGAGSQGGGNGGGGTHAVAERGALLAFLALEVGGQFVEIGGGVGGEAVGFQFVVEGEIADGGGHGAGGGDEGAGA